MALAIGIDLGTTNSVAAVATPAGVEFIRGPNGERTHPSVVAYVPGHSVSVGPAAKAMRVDDGEHVLYSTKRLIGQPFQSPSVQLAIVGFPYRVEAGGNQQAVVVVDEQRLTIPEVSAAILAYLRRCAETQLGEEVTAAVITVPASFTDAQRRATKEAARLAGLEVLRLINEPTAAALAYGLGRNLNETIVVYDFGGGTFDVSVLRIHGEVFEVIGSAGDLFLGGDDLDRAVAEHLASTMNRHLGVDPRGNTSLMLRLQVAAESIKEHLSEHEVAEGEVADLHLPDGRVVALPFQLTRAAFEELIRGYIDRTMDVCLGLLSSANVAPNRVDHVLCVGGSTRVPLVRKRITDVFRKPPMTRIDPDAVVAVGAALQAGSLSGRIYDRGTSRARTGDRPLLLDVAPASLGVQTVGGYTETILAKNLPIPLERARTFSPAADHQARVEIACCRGEARRFVDNEPLGALVLEGLEPKLRADVQIEVTFAVDEDGILSVSAVNLATGEAQLAHLTVHGAPEIDGVAR